MVFEPTRRGTDAVQFVNPLATPLRVDEPTSHLTCVTPTLSDVVPASVIDGPLYENEFAVVGEVIVTVGLMVSGPLDGDVGVVVPPLLVDDVVIAHEKVCDALNTPSDARAVTV